MTSHLSQCVSELIKLHFNRLDFMRRMNIFYVVPSKSYRTTHTTEPTMSRSKIIFIFFLIQFFLNLITASGERTSAFEKCKRRCGDEVASCFVTTNRFQGYYYNLWFEILYHIMMHFRFYPNISDHARVFGE